MEVEFSTKYISVGYAVRWHRGPRIAGVENVGCGVRILRQSPPSELSLLASPLGKSPIFPDVNAETC